MKKPVITFFLFLLFFGCAFSQSIHADFVTTDVNNFWNAYDKVISTKDIKQQYAYLNQLFIDKGTPGLKAMMQVRDYNDTSYIDAINKYPLFWNSIKPNTLKARQFADDIAANIIKLKKLYPDLKPAKIYFTVGAFRSGGTTLDSMVLNGSEIAMADEHTITDEFPANYDGLKTYFKSNPINILVFNNVHEYIHTQQKTTIGNNLLAQCVLEGAAELIAEIATGKPSTLPALAAGKANDAKVRHLFESHLFNTSNGYWLYSSADNEFKTRDMGYYVGYAICSKYYNKATDKKMAIKQMIQLDYNDEAALAAFVNRSGYFAKTIAALKSEYETNRPVVVGIKPFKNNATAVDTANTLITVEFSAPMDQRYRNFELGPAGEENLLMIKVFKGFSEDQRSIVFEVSLKPARHYQLIIGDGFKDKNGVQLKPYLIDFNTAAK